MFMFFHGDDTGNMMNHFIIYEIDMMTYDIYIYIIYRYKYVYIVYR